MDVFKVHEQVIADYRAFTSGFVQPRDDRISSFIDEQFAEGVQWPDPWLSLNPSFATGGAIPELVERGLLNPECGRIFRRKGRRSRHRPGAGDPAPAPARGRGGRPVWQELRPHYGHRLG